MAVHDRDTVALGGHGDVVEVFERGFGGVDAAEDLCGFPLDLVFLAANVRDHVVEDVHAGDAGVAAAGDGLQGGDGDGAEAAKGVVQRFERHDEAGGRAVCVGHDEAARQAVVQALVWDHRKVRGVDEGHHQRRDWVPAVVFGVGEDDEVGFEEFGLCSRGVSRHIETGGAGGLVPISPA